MISFVVHANPEPQGRPRFFHRGGFSGVYELKKNKDYKKVIKLNALMSGVKISSSPIMLHLRFYFNLPKSLASKKFENKKHYNTGRPDLDNLCKIFCDALNGVAWKDDRQVCCCLMQKFYCKENESPRTEVEITELAGSGD